MKIKVLLIIGILLLIAPNVYAACGAFEIPTLGGQCCVPARRSVMAPLGYDCSNNEYKLFQFDNGLMCCRDDDSGGGGPGPTISGSIDEIYIEAIHPRTVTLGDGVNGTLIVKVSCTSDPFSIPPVLKFGPSYEETYSPATCTPNATKTEHTEISSYDFSYIFPEVGKYLVIPVGGSEGKWITVVPASESDPVEPLESGLEGETIPDVIDHITDIVFYILSGLTLMFLVLGGMTIISASGQPEAITRGKNIIKATLIGYAIILIAKGIVELVMVILND